MSDAWPPAKIAAFRAEFLRFLDHATINSKDLGPVILGEHLYAAQRRFLDELFEGLATGIHDFKVGKSRQLGISTLSRALTVFWAGVHTGLKGYMVFDTAQHAQEARLELMDMIDGLPADLGFPKIVGRNRDFLQLEGGTRINFAHAGVQRTKSSGSLGRGSGVSFVHASECSGWAAVEQYESFRNSLSQHNPNRLYIWESTARGYNLWHKMWENAIADASHQKTIFIGWWAKELQQIPRDHADFERYGTIEPDEKELARIASVRERYGVEITAEQLAWYRWMMDPAISSLSDDAEALDEDPLRLQEQPWDESEMFQIAEAIFFSASKLNDQAKDNARSPKSVWKYEFYTEFPDSQIKPADNAHAIDLKVWDEPEQGGVYVISADPAFGASERSDRYCVQVCRAYADGLDQVAEYARVLLPTREFAWVIASLMGWYGAGGNEVYFILEVNGPGSAVLDELRYLKKSVATGYMSNAAAERGLTDLFRNVKNYFYSRPDAVNPSNTTLHWKTSGAVKVRLMERLRDFTASGMLRVRSRATLEEMRTITREGDTIEAAQGNKDDRVIALGLGVRCWEDRARQGLSHARRTRQVELTRVTMTFEDKVKMMTSMQLQSMFAVKAAVRRRDDMALRRQAWRSRR